MHSEQNKCQVSLEYVKNIINFVEPNVQRNINEKHVQSIVNDQKHEYNKWKTFSILQAISVGNVANDKVYILDGNHRIRAFRILHEEGFPIMDIQIPLVVHNLFDETELIYYYNKINQNMPIHPIELQENFADFGKIFIENITKTFDVYLKYDTKNPRCPHMSMQELKKNFSGRDIGAKLKLNNNDIKTFWNTIIDFNSYVKDNIKSHNQLCAMMKKRIVDCENKCQKFHCKTPCYLGVWRKFEWLDFCLNSVLNGVQFQDMDLSCEKLLRKQIPYIVREQVWKKVNVTMVDIGICFTCNNDLYFRDMECGHIIAHALGGIDNVDNLMPICKTCNKDMGIMNLFEYKGMIEKMSN
jgi:hypothetical protein